MRSLVASIALALPLLSGAAPINHVVNGSFEANALANGQWRVLNAASNGGNSLTQPLSGWTLVSGPGIELRRNVAGTAQQGQQYVELDSYSNSAMSQSFSNLLAGVDYELSFWLSPRAGVAAASNGMRVLWNGQTVSSLSPNGQGLNNHQWTEFHFDLRALQGVNTLSFASFGTNDGLGASLDNVSLVQQVPVPASLALVGLGLLGLGLSRRRA